MGGVFDTNAEQVPGISNADIVVLIRNNWQEAREVYNAGGLEIVGQQLPDAATYDPDTFVNVTNLTLPDGRPIRFYTFIRDVGGDLQYDGCMARLVLDDTYRGEANADFDSTVCSAQFN